MHAVSIWWVALLYSIAVTYGFVLFDGRLSTAPNLKYTLRALELHRFRSPLLNFKPSDSYEPSHTHTGAGRPLLFHHNQWPKRFQWRLLSRAKSSIAPHVTKNRKTKTDDDSCEDASDYDCADSSEQGYDYDDYGDYDDYDDYDEDYEDDGDEDYDKEAYDEDDYDEGYDDLRKMGWSAFNDMKEEAEDEKMGAQIKQANKKDYPSTVHSRSRGYSGHDDDDDDGDGDGDGGMREIPDTSIKDLKYLNSSYPARPMNQSIQLSEEGRIAETLPVVAVIGRPNVGKSTVVNRLAGKHRSGAIVYNEAGVTRDRSYHVGRYNNYYFQIVDTGGILFNDKAGEVFARHIREQAEQALEDCSAAIFVTDVRDGITELDKQIARYLKSKGKPVLLVVNKAEGRWGEAEKFVRLGLGQAYPISGVHGVGLADVMDDLTRKYLEQVSVLLPDEKTNVAVIGRPNVGKSSLFNRLYGQNRSIVSNIAGTTRDSIDATITFNDRRYQIVDTAGVRKKSKIPKGTEYLMVNRALKALTRSDVSLLIIDAPEGITEQDRVLAKRIALDGRACVIVLNKWDAIPDKDEKMHDQGIKYVHEQVPDLAWAEVLMVSAKTGQRCTKIFEAVDKARESHNRRYSTSVINNVLRDALLWEPPPAITGGGATGRIYYATQVATAPPTITLFCNNPRYVPDSYKRYLERRFREALKFEGTPLRLRWRARTVRAVERISKHKLRAT